MGPGVRRGVSSPCLPAAPSRRSDPRRALSERGRRSQRRRSRRRPKHRRWHRPRSREDRHAPSERVWPRFPDADGRQRRRDGRHDRRGGVAPDARRRPPPARASPSRLTPRPQPGPRVPWGRAAGAAHALIAIGANAEGVGPGPADITFYEVGYRGDGPYLVPNARFDQGLLDWGETSGDGSPTVVISGSGSMLRMVVTRDQWLYSASGSFPVTGAAFRTWAAVRVPEALDP